MTVIWTRHAQERQQEWQKRLGVTRQEVETLVANPGQIVPGDGDAMVAQGRRGEGLLRVVFREVAGDRKILTVYWTSRIERYWTGGEHAG
jgi:hypothetical protein